MPATIASILQDGKDPSMPALRGWLQNLSSAVSANVRGLRVFGSNAYTPTGVEPTYAFVADGETFKAYRYDGGWDPDDTYFEGLAAVVQPQVDLVEAAAAEVEASLGEVQALLYVDSVAFDPAVAADTGDGQQTGGVAIFATGTIGEALGPGKSLVEEIEIYSAAAITDVKLKRAVFQTDGKLSAVTNFATTSLVDGVNILTAPDDFTAFVSDESGMLGYYAPTDGVCRRTGGTVGCLYIPGDYQGGPVTPLQAPFQIMMKARVRRGTVARAVDDLAARVDASADALRGSTSFFDTSFATIDDWALIGGPTFNAGIVSPAVANQWGALAVKPGLTTSNRRKTQMMAEVTNLNSQFGIAFGSVQGENRTGYFELDIPNARLVAYYWHSAGVAGDVLFEAPLSFPPTIGNYLLDLRKVNFGSVFTVTNVSTGETSTLTCEHKYLAQCGNVAALFRTSAAGGVVIRKARYLAQVKQDPWAVFLGDSLTDSTAAPMGTLALGQLTDAKRGKGDVIVCGRGGDSTTTALIRLAWDVSAFTAEYVVCGFGTNADSDRATWRANYQQIINAVTATGAKFIAVVPPPWVAQASRLAGYRADLRGTDGFAFTGITARIDLDKALSPNRDGAAWVPEYVLADGFHISPAGYEAAFRQLAYDAPQLLD
jgi:lysophospholipase L1-like esterase